MRVSSFGKDVAFSFMKARHSARNVRALAGVPSKATGRAALRRESLDVGAGVAASPIDAALAVVLVRPST